MFETDTSMAEQEIDLDTAIQLFQLVHTFDEYAEGLREVLKKSTKVSDPNKARERVMEVADAKKADLMANNPEFKSIMDQRTRENKQRAEYDRAIHRAQMADAEAKASMARSDAMSSVRGAIPNDDLGDFVAKTRFKKVEPEELEKKSKKDLWCPIHREKDNHNNIVNGYPTCVKCWHRLVPEAELKNYNRSYRRRWKKNRS